MQSIPELDLAKSLWARRKYDESIEAFTRALRRRPNDETVLVDAARAFGLRYELERAEELIDRLLRHHGWRPEIQCLCGATYRMLGRFPQAAVCFERACSGRLPLPRARVELAEMYERLHDLDRAFEAASAALASDSRFARAALIAARVHRRRRDFADAERVLLEQLDNPPPNAETHALLWGELGLVYDEVGQYEKAFDSAVAGKQIQQAGSQELSRQADFIRRQSERMLAEITAAHFQRWRDGLQDAPAARLALLTGHPRSGTTLLEQVLDSHPEAVSSDERTVLADDVFPALGAGVSSAEHSMPAMLDIASRDRVLEQRGRYLRYMEALLGEPIGNRLHLDKNPELTLLIPAMMRLFPETKIIFALRDPRDVVVSCFMRPLPSNSVTVNYATLETTAEKYAFAMHGWIKLRELLASPWLEVRYEDAVENLERQARRTLEFLDLRWDERVLNYHVRAQQKHVRSPSYERVASPVYRSAVGRWQNYAKYLEPSMNTLQPLVEAFDYT